MKKAHQTSTEKRQVQSPRADGARLSTETFLLCAALFLITLALYWPAHRFGFVYDDLKYITLNPHVLGGLNSEGMRWAFTSGYASNWHPVTWLSHMLDVALFGANPGPMHDTNARLHALNAVLLFLFLNRVTGGMWRSAFVAALFAWHPLHVESAAWISERKDLLAALFGIVALWSYAEFARNRSARFYVVAFLALALGLMCKPMLVTWPFVMLLLDGWPLRRFGRERTARLLLEKLPFLALSVASSVVTMVVQRGAMSSLEYLPFSARVANAGIAGAAYLAKTFFLDRNLAVIYPYPGTWPAWRIAGSVLVLAGISIFAGRFARRAPYFLVGWLWYLGTLVPVIGLVQVGLQSMADRYTYLPLLGIFIAVTWGAGDLLERFPRPIAPGLAAMVLAACLATAHAQLAFWKDGVTLFSHAIEVTERNETARYNLGIALADAGEFDRAIAEYREALKINPGSAQTHNSLGSALAHTGKLDEAIAEFTRAVQCDGGFADAHYNLGLALSRSGQTKAAVEAFRAALRVLPDYPEALNNLAWILATNENTGIRDGRQAVALATRACELTGRREPRALQTLAAALAETGEFERALSVAAQARDLAVQSSDTELDAVISREMELYRAQKPERETRKKGDR